MSLAAAYDLETMLFNTVIAFTTSIIDEIQPHGYPVELRIPGLCPLPLRILSGLTFSPLMLMS